MTTIQQSEPHTHTTDALLIRPFRWDDLPRLVEIFNAHAIANGEDNQTTVQEWDKELRSPNINAETDVFMAASADGTLVGVANLEFSPESLPRQSFDFSVDPGYDLVSVGSQLIRVIEDDVSRRILTQLPQDTPVGLECFTADTAVNRIALIQSHGYAHVRTFYRMKIDFDGVIEDVPLPEGFELRPFDLDQHARLVYEAHQESFRDHWGWTAYSFEEWSHWVINNPENDPTLWQIAWDTAADRIAALCLNRRYGDMKPELGWVGTLGTRRDYRKRGLGDALLRKSFRTFQQRGFTSAGLGVDAGSLTNALALYERAGMTVNLRWFMYAKMMRGEWMTDLYGEKQ